MVRFNSGETSQANMAAFWTKYNTLKYIVRQLGEVEEKGIHSLHRHCNRMFKHFQQLDWHESG